MSKIITLLVRLQRQAVQFARRNSAYARYEYGVSSGQETLIYKKFCNGEYRDRYVALNLCNRSTIEYRIFRGTLRPETILASIEFAHALTAYAGRQTYPHVVNWTTDELWADFARYCLSGGYHYICHYMVYRGQWPLAVPPKSQKPQKPQKTTEDGICASQS